MFSVTFVIAGAALVVIALVISFMFLRHSDRWLHARAIKRLGFGVIAVFSVLAGLFIAGEAFEEPGGTGAISLVLSWLIPLVGLAGLAWYRPSLATPIVIVLSGAVVLASLWFAVDSDAWRVVEDQYGPVRAVAVFGLSAAVGVLGLKRTAIAGWLLIALGLFPVAASSLGSFGGAVSLSAVSVIPLITGMLYLISARLDRRSASVNLRGSEGVIADSTSDASAHR
jgi:hypothetical protein